MKNNSLSTLLITTAIFGMVATSNAQNTFPTGVGTNAGIGITSPNANLQLYSNTDYIISNRNGSTNYGKTSRVLLTTSNSGSSQTDGFEIRYSGTNATLTNQENNATIGLKTSGAVLSLQGSFNRITAGSGVISNANTFGYFNVQSTGDNGIFIRTFATGKFGMRVQVLDATTNAMEVVNAGNTSEKTFEVNGGGQVKMLVANASTNALEVLNQSNNTEKNFTVNGGGQVYARKYTTTLANIPDYVFEKEYKLMSLDSLQNYITLNNHLPNVPSAKEYEKEGVDLGEMNRILLEKVEELTLYILELNKEIEKLKTEVK